MISFKKERKKEKSPEKLIKLHGLTQKSILSQHAQLRLNGDYLLYWILGNITSCRLQSTLQLNTSVSCEVKNRNNE